MKSFLFFAAMAAATSAGAQNLVRNPNFDKDASGWQLSMFSSWSDRVDHGNSPFSGALQITTRDTDYVAQCVAVNASTRYAISAWVEKDPQASISPCSEPTNRIRIDFLDAPQCGGSTTGIYYPSGPRVEADGWQNIAFVLKTQETTQSALLTLYGECETAGTGISIHYYDDILFEADEILQADFESQDQPATS